MNNKKFRNKFIKIAFISVAIVMTLLFVTVNLFAVYRTNKLFDSVLIHMIENGGKLPIATESSPNQLVDRYFDNGFISKSFTISVSQRGEKKLESERFPDGVDKRQSDILDNVLSKGKTSGKMGPYRYYVGEYHGTTMIAFGDFEQEEMIMSMYLESSLWISSIAMLMLLMLLAYFSDNLVRPMVENAERQKAFISNAGHELKTPLAIISANAQVLELEVGEDNVWINNIQNQTNRMATLIENLLQLSFMGGEDIPSLFESFELSSLVLEVADSFQVVANGKDCSITTNVESDISFFGDEKMIRELIMILCDNSIKYATQGSVIHMNLSNSTGKIVFDVENQIEEENLPDITKIFDRFYRADSSRARESGGYGLGLSIAKRITMLHHGEIKADILKEDKNNIRFTVTI